MQATLAEAAIFVRRQARRLASCRFRTALCVQTSTPLPDDNVRPAADAYKELLHKPVAARHLHVHTCTAGHAGNGLLARTCMAASCHTFRAANRACRSCYQESLTPVPGMACQPLKRWSRQHSSPRSRFQALSHRCCTQDPGRTPPPKRACTSTPSPGGSTRWQRIGTLAPGKQRAFHPLHAHTCNHPDHIAASARICRSRSCPRWQASLRLFYWRSRITSNLSQVASSWS
mmetsp:Transcript_26365/g.61159  ORF Transcript_26365/g.61159 Transcript_26365/m.61159 type:complete len:231 (-) Transcript_26365:8-700(-)